MILQFKMYHKSEDWTIFDRFANNCPNFPDEAAEIRHVRTVMTY